MRSEKQVKPAFRNAVQRLAQAGISDPELEVSLLLAHAMQIERTTLLLAGKRMLTDDQLEIFEQSLARRLCREPSAYITGEKEFWSLPFIVSGAVLVPRPETEFLLEKSLAILHSTLGRGGRKNRILDLGTGSGVIAVVMALELAATRVTAVDRSCRALQVARQNAHRHGVADRIDFINCDWFAGLGQGAVFDAVVSNPPYVAREILARPGGSPGGLQPEVTLFEPGLALDGGAGGLQEISRIAALLGGKLKPGGWFFMEIGADQKNGVLDIFRKTAMYDSMAVFDDYAGRPRVFQARRI